MSKISHEEATDFVLAIAPKTCIAHRLIMDSAIEALVNGTEPAYQLATKLNALEARYEREEALVLQRQLVGQMQVSNDQQAQGVKVQERVASAVTSGLPTSKREPSTGTRN